jgi:hypothetical protein
MDRFERCLILSELQTLNVDYWYDVDMNWGRTAHEYFVEDGVYYAAKDAVFKGRDEIRKFYSWRESRGARLARHLVSNFRVVLEGERHATATWVLSLYAADGEPVLPSVPPIQTADCSDVCVRQDDGRWRYVSRRLTTIFASSTPVTIPPPGAVTKA